ncbi:MAG: beta-ketoacyl-ACP synthase II [Coxiellaceae bacterium]|nr:beta-ketoacyl-ACP synthase II [Coxiellaceae bacterium]
MKRRVVVTGLGIVSPVGNAVETAWEAVLNGKSGVSRQDFLEDTDTQTKIAARVKDFDPSLCLNSKETRRLALFIQFALEAARQAIEDANLTVDDELAPRAGAAIGSGIGGLGWIEENHSALLDGGARKISPFFIPGAVVNMAPGYASMKHNLRGPNISIATSCTTGTHNIGSAMRIIQYGDADVMITGGAEMATDILGIGGFNAARALSTRNDEPEKACRPWDKNRDGFVLGEGAGVLVLEEYEFAKKRGAKIYAELVGFGMSSDAYHMTAPDPSCQGFVSVMESTLKDAGVGPELVDYVNAHATSTGMLDPLELESIKTVFADCLDQLAISSTKSMTGHLLGAAGAAEAIFSILAMRDQIAPPTINLDDPIEAAEGVNLVPHKAQKRKIDYVLSNSFGFGGTNGSLLFKKI